MGMVGLESGTHDSAFLAALKDSPVAQQAGVVLLPALRSALAAALEPFGAPAYQDSSALQGVPLLVHFLDIVYLPTRPRGPGRGCLRRGVPPPSATGTWAVCVWGCVSGAHEDLLSHSLAPHTVSSPPPGLRGARGGPHGA
jgi:hypothetical protein